MRRTFLFLLLLSLCISGTAIERSEEEMVQAAISVLNGSVGANHKVQRHSSIKKLKQMSELAIYGYDDGGFAVITADTRFRAVIGYSETLFSGTAVPCGFEWWLKSINSVMESGDCMNEPLSKVKKSELKASVAPLMTTKWGQGHPYNDLCTWNGHQFVTGCVATAMAQVMKYHKYPQKGTDSYSYVIHYTDLGDAEFSSNFSEHQYDWNNMLNQYNSGGYSSEQANAVALLMSDCGIAVGMIYRSSVSSAYFMMIDYALKKYFSFTDGTERYFRSDHSTEDWMNLIYEAINNGRPIIYRGAESETDSNGHAFVLHGYDEQGNVYVNWGWNGSFDGYYSIDLLNPGSDNYSYGQCMVLAVPGQKSEYDLTYYLNGVVYKSYKKAAGETIVPEPAPEKEGYTFSGWSEVPSIMPAHDLNIYGELISPYQLDGHEYCDLELPSGNVWASNNYGASNELQSGEYLNWYSNGEITQSWGDKWFTPSRADFQELIDNCSWTWESNNGVNGYKVTGKNGNFMFLPASGFQVMGMPQSFGQQLYYWTTDTGNEGGAYTFCGASTWYHANNTTNTGLVTCPIRPVAKGINGNKEYTLCYMVDGSVYKSFQLKEGDLIIPEPEPHKEGYTFSGWSDIPATMPAHDVIVTGSFISNTQIQGHEYVDLGLPSGNVWATLNYGSSAISASGNYASWNSTDIVAAGWGDKWSIPTREDFKELLNYCAWTWGVRDGINGYIVTGTNGNSIFFPASGFQIMGSTQSYGSQLYYLTSTLDNDPSFVYVLSGHSGSVDVNAVYNIALMACPIRPVAKNTVVRPTYELRYMVDGTLYKSYKLEEGAAITPEPAPVREGYTFSGWSEIPATMPAQDVTIYGSFISTCQIDGHAYVDLYLPSGNAWAITNISDMPPYYEHEHTWWPWSDSRDNVKQLWGNQWSTPSKSDFQELIDYCTWTWEKHNGFFGYRVTGRNGKSIFLTALGYVKENQFLDDGTKLLYWTSDKSSPDTNGFPFALYADPSNTINVDNYYDSNVIQCPIRPVSKNSIERQYFTLKYLVDGELYKSIQVQELAHITPEPAPEKEGYTFSGWDSVPSTMPAHDVTVKGTFTINKYRLTYKMNGELFKEYLVEYQAKMPVPEIPYDDGYDYSYVYEQLNMVNLRYGGVMPAWDVTVDLFLYPRSFKLTYMLDGKEYKVVNQLYDTEITPEPAPEKEGYSFSGWEGLPERMPAKDVTATGTMTVNKYKLIYVIDGEVYKTLTLEYGATVTIEPNPTKEGHTFMGWSNLPQIMPAHDVTVTGSFTVNKYVLTYLLDGMLYKTLEVDYGSTIIPEPAPERDGYSFSGWIGLPETMPAHMVIVTGTFTSGIVTLEQLPQGSYRIYTPDGKLLDKPRKGLNMVVMADGTVKKLVVKEKE